MPRLTLPDLQARAEVKPPAPDKPIIKFV